MHLRVLAGVSMSVDNWSSVCRAIVWLLSVGARLRRRFSQLVDKSLLARAIDPGRRLVEEQQFGFWNQRAGDQCSL